MAGKDKDPAGKIRDLLSARRLGHDANQLLVDIMEQWGGTRQFAADLYAVYHDPMTTAYGRQNILEMIQKLVVNNTNHNITKVIDPTDLETDEIEAEIAGYIGRAVGHVNHEPEPVPPTQGPAWEAEGPLDDGWDWPVEPGGAECDPGADPA